MIGKRGVSIAGGNCNEVVEILEMGQAKGDSRCGSLPLPASL